MGKMLSRFSLAVVVLSVALTSSGIHAQQSSSGSSSSKAKHGPEQRVRSAPPGTSDEGTYRNPNFGFTYRVRYGWVDRTRQMHDENDDPAKSQLLLAVFEHPPEVTGDSVNSAVIIAAESVNSYPGLKTAADYMGPLTELTASQGFKVAHEPYEYPVGTKTLVRSDFVKELGKLAMHQSSLVLLEKRFFVSFTFIGESDDEVEGLIEKLSVNNAKPQ
jgi:hypothetical protein